MPQESVSSWLIDFIVSSQRQSHKKHQFNDTSFVLWEVRNSDTLVQWFSTFLTMQLTNPYNK